MTGRRSWARSLAFGVALALAIAGCGQGEQTVDPGPEETDASTTSTSTTVAEEPDEQANDDDSDDDDRDSEESEVVTDGDVTTTTVVVDAPIGTGDGVADDAADEFIVSEDTENAAVFIELADSGLVLTVDEQTCVDDTSTGAIAEGAAELDGVIEAVRSCASPAAMDDFASTLIVAGGQALPPTEAACVASLLRDGEGYRPFWSTLLEAEQFDFLLAETDVQNQYLDLYSDCVSVGRAVAEQTNSDLSTPTVGCIDELYADREFVRITIEADLSGNVEDLARIDSQLSGCMTAEEQELIYGS